MSSGAGRTGSLANLNHTLLASFRQLEHALEAEGGV